MHGFVYWSDSPYIKQATLNGSNTKIVVRGTGKMNVTPLQMFIFNLFDIFCQYLQYFVTLFAIIISQNN